jgi:hypothetical protein
MTWSMVGIEGNLDDDHRGTVTMICDSQVSRQRHPWPFIDLSKDRVHVTMVSCAQLDQQAESLAAVTSKSLHARTYTTMCCDIRQVLRTNRPKCLLVAKKEDA